MSAGPAEEVTEHQAFVRLSSVLTGMKQAELPEMVEQNDASGVRLRLPGRNKSVRTDRCCVSSPDPRI
jgi:hypothetical protein